MTAAALPPGVVAAGKPGRCACCGEQYPAGAHARRYAGGLRPVACGCHAVTERPQTAPAQPIAGDPPAAADREQLQRDLNVERRRVVSLQGQADARTRDLERCRHAQAEADRTRAQLRRRVGAALGLTTAHTHAATDDDLVLFVEHAHAAAAAAADRGAPSSEPDSPDGGAPTEATPSSKPHSATTAPAPASAPSSPTAVAAAASPASPRSFAAAEPRPRSIDDVPEYSTPTSHICAAPACNHREKLHDADGCTVRRCACARFERR